MIARLITLIAFAFAPTAYAETTRFCLEGEFDLGGRFQGTHPNGGEFYPTTWCVVTDDKTGRVQFSGSGRSNPDMDGHWEVAYLPSGLVRIINRDAPPDIEFHGADSAGEALSVRWLDPHRLMSDYFKSPGQFDGLSIGHRAGLLTRVETTAVFPLRGRVSVTWQWDWADADHPAAELLVDGDVIFRARGRWETLDEEEAVQVWMASPGAEPVEVPGDRWPSRVDMQLIDLADGVHLVGGVRTGFQHLVVETSEGLVVGDAPAGWVELHQVPPSDLVPGLGVSGLSEGLVDFLKHEFPDQEIAAVAITHFHDDHAGGARALAAAGALVYAPAASEAFLEKSLNRPAMPADRLKLAGSSIDVIPVAERITIGAGDNRAQLVPLGANPHVDAMLGVWAMDRGYFFVSDIHVPRSDSEVPRAERALTECWFAGQALSLLPETVQVVNSHSGVITPVSRFRQYLESEACSRAEPRKNGG